jgi:hypothetical protein
VYRVRCCAGTRLRRCCGRALKSVMFLVPFRMLQSAHVQGSRQENQTVVVRR